MTLHTDDLTSAGERVDPQSTLWRSHNERLHRERYAWASDRVTGEVLDAACGTGYGSALLSEGARVTGVDVEPRCIELARARSPGVTFIESRLPDLPFETGRFDSVVCFETVEHVSEDRALMASFRRVLRPNGRLLLSSPNRAVTSPDGDPQNPWHVREYTLEELRQLVTSAGFTVHGVYQQAVEPASAVGRAARWALTRFPRLWRVGPWISSLGYGGTKVERAAVADRPTILILDATAVEEPYVS